MTRHDDCAALLHMRDHAAEAIAISQGRSRGELDSDRIFTLALIKLVEIVGEAAGRISPAIQTTHPNIPWKQVVGTRNRLVHAYDEVDLDILWQIVSLELPRLVAELEAIIEERPDNNS